MSDLEIFEMNSEGAGWVPLSLADKVSIEIDLATKAEVKLLCITCSVPVPDGMGHSYCERHLPNYPACTLCGCSMMGALYCRHCFTGVMKTSPSGERYHDTYPVPRCGTV